MASAPYSTSNGPPTHTIETLIGECVGRYITATNGAVQLANLINHRTYAKCWAALMTWSDIFPLVLLSWALIRFRLPLPIYRLDYQSRHGHSAALPPLGVVLRSQTARPGFVKLVGAPSLVDQSSSLDLARSTSSTSGTNQLHSSSCWTQWNAMQCM
jgi:hypothetical protein